MIDTRMPLATETWNSNAWMLFRDLVHGNRPLISVVDMEACCGRPCFAVWDNGRSYFFSIGRQYVWRDMGALIDCALTTPIEGTGSAFICEIQMRRYIIRSVSRELFGEKTPEARAAMNELISRVP